MGPEVEFSDYYQVGTIGFLFLVTFGALVVVFTSTEPYKQV